MSSYQLEGGDNQVSFDKPNGFHISLKSLQAPTPSLSLKSNEFQEI